MILLQEIWRNSAKYILCKTLNLFKFSSLFFVTNLFQIVMCVKQRAMFCINKFSFIYCERCFKQCFKQRSHKCVYHKRECKIVKSVSFSKQDSQYQLLISWSSVWLHMSVKPIAKIVDIRIFVNIENAIGCWIWTFPISTWNIL